MVALIMVGAILTLLIGFDFAKTALPASVLALALNYRLLPVYER